MHAPNALVNWYMECLHPTASYLVIASYVATYSYITGRGSYLK